MGRLSLAVALCAFALQPYAAQAQAAAPSVACDTIALRVGAAEVNGLRVHCSVSGAADDQLLRVVSGQTRAVCEVALVDGSGDCMGIALGSPDVGSMVAVLMPSGNRFDVLPQQPAEAPPQLQSTPVPASDASPPETDEPAPDSGLGSP